MRNVLRLLLLLLLVVSPSLGLAQIHTFPALDTNNNWTGINTFPTGSLNLGNTNFLSSATVTRTFTFPDANSNPVQPSTAPSNQFATGISSAGVISYGQPAFGNLLGAIALSQTPLTTRGDLLVVGSGPALARLPIGAANLYPKSNGTDIVFSTLAAGGVGSCTNQVVTSLNADAAPTCATVSPVLTTGTTGTGSTFVLSVSPTLTTPNLGDATATSIVVSGAISAGTVSSTGGALNGSIGATTPGSGAFTTLSASTSFHAPGIIDGNIIGIDGTKYPKTCAGLQQALTDACTINATFPGTAIFLPPMHIVSCNVVQTCALSIWGSGPSHTDISSATGVTWHLQPSANHQPHEQWEFFNFEIDSNAGSTMDVDDTTAPVNRLWVHRMVFNPAGRGTDWSFNLVSTQNNGGFDWLIENNTFEAGINIGASSTTSGTVDGLAISHNSWDNASTDSNPCIHVAQSDGAGNLQIDHNRGGCNGGEVVIDQSVNPMLLNNQFEHSAGPGTASNCMIELNAAHVSNAYLLNNNLNNHGSPGTATKDVCLNGVSGVVLMHNIMAVPAGGSGVNSSATYTMYSNIIGLGAGASQTSGTGVPFAPALFSTVPVSTTPPTAACTIGTGCSTSISTGSTNLTGQIVVTTGTSPSSTGTVTINFNGTFGANQTSCTFAYGNGSGSWTAPITAITQTATTSQYVVSLTNGGTFPASSTLGLKYHCFPF